MDTKPGKVLTYSEKLPSLKSHGPFEKLYFHHLKTYGQYIRDGANIWEKVNANAYVVTDLLFYFMLTKEDNKLCIST